MPMREYVRRREIEYEELHRQEQRLLDEYDKHLQPIRDKMDQVVRILGDLRDARCVWPGCKEPPKPRSKWCQHHKPLHEREMARNRQRRHRDRCHASGAASRLLEH
jgi:hypothetical protein